MFGREPAVIIAVLMAVVQAVMIYTTGDVDASVPSWLLPVLTALVGVLVRQKVIPVKTVKQAGLSPADVKERAKDPRIPRYTGA